MNDIECENMPLKHDPIEDNPEIKKIIEKAREEIDRKLKTHERRGKVGFSKIFARELQKLLKEKHNVDWKTPSQMNPRKKFD